MVDAVLTSRPSSGGGGGSFTAGSPPSPVDETAQLFAQVDVDTRPEVLYLFDGDVTNDGNLGAAGLPMRKHWVALLQTSGMRLYLMLPPMPSLLVGPMLRSSSRPMMVAVTLSWCSGSGLLR